MACPTCGATGPRAEIAPGHWRCQAMIDSDVLVGAPAPWRGDAAGPSSGRRPCDTAYESAPTAPADEDADATAAFTAVGRRPSVPVPPLPPRRPAPSDPSACTQTFARPPGIARPPAVARPPAAARPPMPASRPAPPSRPAPSAPAPAPDRCRCGARPIATCEECSRPVCGDHSTLWRGWRVCDHDLAAARARAQAAAEEEERRVTAAAAAAKAERVRLRNTLLDLTPEQALLVLYVQERRTEQEVRSAVHVLRRVPTEQFTRLCLAVLPRVTRAARSRRNRLRRLSGWPFAGEHYHDRSWFLTKSGTWYRSGSYGESGAEQGYYGRKIRLDDTEKRAVIYDMSWQQAMTWDLERP